MSFKNILAAILVVAMPVASAFAGQVTLATDQSTFSGSKNQGWWSSGTGFANSNINDNYYTGDVGGYDLRSFFTFDRSGIVGNVTAATLRIQRADQYAPVNLTLWDVTTSASAVNYNEGSNMAIYADLGSGISYGSFVVASGAYADYLDFALNADGLAALNSATGFFTVGASVGAGQVIFSSSGSVNFLNLEVGPALPANPVPEPAPLALLLLGMGGLAAARRRK